MDDQPANCALLAEMLEAEGYRCAQTRNTHDGWAALLAAARTGKLYQVALIDAALPGEDSLRFGRRIAEDPLLAQTKLVLLVALGQREDRLALKGSGFAGTISKPVRRAKLVELLTDLFAPTEPDRVPHASPKSATPTPGDEPSFARRVLVVEDNRVNQMVVLMLLKKAGCQAEAVGNGLEAIAALQRQPYDIVFMDCQMPEMDGYEATRRIRDPRSGVRNSTIPIVAMTAHAMEGDREVCLAAGMDDYIAKPVRPQEVTDMLQRWLGNHRSSAA